MCGLESIELWSQKSIIFVSGEEIKSFYFFQNCPFSLNTNWQIDESKKIPDKMPKSFFSRSERSIPFTSSHSNKTNWYWTCGPCNFNYCNSYIDNIGLGWHPGKPEEGTETSAIECRPCIWWKYLVLVGSSVGL